MVTALWLGGGALLLVLLGALAWRARRRRRAAARVEAQLRAPLREVEPSLAPPSLATDIARALSAAHGGRSAKRRAAAQPRYLVLDDGAAGERCVLSDAGLRRARVAEGSACWLADEALLVRIPAPGPVDHAAQDRERAGLEVLRRARPRRTIDGVLACVDVGLLTGADATALEAHTHTLRARLVSLTAQTGVCPPVYLLLTGCERLPGFATTFATLPRPERRRPWGFSLETRVGGVRVEEVVGRLARLVQVLERRAVASMTAPRTLDECAAVYALPAAVAALEAPLAQLVRTAFGSESGTAAPFLRGVYLTGVAAPGQAVASDELATLPVAPAAPEPLFLRDLLVRVVLPDVGLSQPSAARATRRRRAALVAALGLNLLTVGFASLEVRAYGHNQRVLDDLRHALRAAGSARQPGVDAIAPLRRGARMLRAHAQDGVPAELGLGLYQGHLLRPEVERLYASIVRNHWVAPHVQQLAARLGAKGDLLGPPAAPSGAAEHARLYALLERYLRWTRDDGQAPPRGDLSAAWLIDGLLDALPEAPREHVATYLAMIDDRPALAPRRDPGLVTAARARLGGMPAASIAVDRIERELAPRGPTLSLDALLGATGTPLAASQAIPFAFTRRGWEGHVRALLDAPPEALLGAAWVLGEAAAASGEAGRRACALRSAYFARYAEAWRALLGSLRLAPPREATDALAVLQALTRGEPPALERLASEVARNAQLDPPEPVAEVPPSGLLAQLKQSLGSTARAASPQAVAASAACDAQGDHSPATVRAALRGFHRFGIVDASPAPGTPPPVTASRLYHEQLVYVRDAMQAHQLDPSDAEPLLARLATAEVVVRQLIDAQEVGWRPRFEAILAPPLRGARATTSGDLVRQTAASWCTAVVLPFAQGLAHRYPFAKDGQDASLGDVVAFYRPREGIVWSAYEALLARDLPRSGDRFRARPGSSLARRYRAQLPLFLERSQAIARSLFGAADGAPQVAFDVRVRPTPEVASIALEVDGQRVEFHNGPERWMPLRWPGEGPVRGATLRVRGAGIDETLAQEGDWGIFRLIDSGTVSARADERSFSVRFRLRTQRDVVIDVRPARADHPFVGASGTPLEVFRAPGIEAPREIAEGAKVCR